MIEKSVRACFVGLVLFGVALPAVADRLVADWPSAGEWMGPSFFANPLQDWSIKDGEVEVASRVPGFMTWLPAEVGEGSGKLRIELVGRFIDGPRGGEGPHCLGVRLGVKGLLADSWIHRSVYPARSQIVGINADGKLVVGGATLRTPLQTQSGVQLIVEADIEGDTASVRLTATDGQDKTATLEEQLKADSLRGGIVILAGKLGERIDYGRPTPKWRIASLTAEGDLLKTYPDRSFGPILWSQYTLSDQTLKLLAQLPPMSTQDRDKPVRLERRTEDGWEQIASAEIEPRSGTALFRIDDWDDAQDHELRVAFDFNGSTDYWETRVRRNPVDSDRFSIAVLNCDNGYAFPQPRMMENISVQDPDLLFYAGDQIYEAETGKFGVLRSRQENRAAELDYLRKWFIFGWQNRDLLADRPAAIIPDDHDAFQGNLFGAGGAPRPVGGRAEAGGYYMHPTWVNMMERTQTGHLPDPIDPEPLPSGIGVYFTRMFYGGGDFAILEDRKWKSGFDTIWKSKINPSGTPRPGHDQPEAYDLAELELLGPRQEAFLEKWADDPKGDFRVALSQSMFAAASTHLGFRFKPNEFDMDANSWPQTPRNRAVRALGRAGAITLHGDQHLGVLAHLGADEWEDGPISFMATGVTNGFPRAWWPDRPGKPGPYTTGPDLGRYYDDFGNRLTVIAVANPDPDSGDFDLGWNRPDPETVADSKGSGYGMVTFNRDDGSVTFEMYRVLFDARRPAADDQYHGFPITLPLPEAR